MAPALLLACAHPRTPQQRAMSGDPLGAVHGVGDPAKIAACETLLGEPAGAGIPGTLEERP